MQRSSVLLDAPLRMYRKAVSCLSAEPASINRNVLHVWTHHTQGHRKTKSNGPLKTLARELRTKKNKEEKIWLERRGWKITEQKPASGLRNHHCLVKSELPSCTCLVQWVWVWKALGCVPHTPKGEIFCPFSLGVSVASWGDAGTVGLQSCSIKCEEESCSLSFRLRHDFGQEQTF